MNIFDAVIVVVAVLAAIGGYRLGFFARSLSWIGLALALLIAIRFLPDLMTALASASPRGRLFAGLSFVIGLALLGQAIGLAFGTFVNKRLPGDHEVRRSDQFAGAAVGVVGALLFVWLLVPALASAPGWTAKQTRSSAIVSVIERLAPKPPSSFLALGRMVAEAPFPEVLAPDAATPVKGAPSEQLLAPLLDKQVRSSIVRVEGQACDQIQNGSGFVVGPDLVVTNAHVVAGERDTVVYDLRNRPHAARVVHFDPRRDLAVLHVPRLSLPELPLGEASINSLAVVYGHPAGGVLQPSPARITDRIDAIGTDIYRTSETNRDVFVLAAKLEPGDSGAALVDLSGAVVGVAFAIDPSASGTAYALTRSELNSALKNISNVRTDTGYCLIG